MSAVELKVSIPKTLKKQLYLLTTAQGNKIVRNALKAAARPALKHLKNEVRLLRTASDLSSGTTFNSLTSKATYPSKGRKDYGYFFAGVDKSYSE